MKNREYLSVIEKWLHYDRDYTHRHVAKLLGYSATVDYVRKLRSPWKYFTIEQMEKLAFLLDKDLSEIFWACYKKPYAKIAHDEELVKLHQSLDRAGIK